MRRFEWAAAAWCLIAVPAVAVPARAQDARFQRGDVNGDGSVDVSDPIRTLLHLFGRGAKLACDDAADTNDDGTIDLTDALFTLGFLFRDGARIPPPHDACGSDPTADALGCRENASCGTPAPGVVSVEVRPRSVLLTGAGVAAPLSARAFDAAGGEIIGEVRWRSSNESLARVDADGLVTAVAGIGSAQIVAEVDGVASAPVLVIAAAPVEDALLVDDDQLASAIEAVDATAAYGLGWRYRVTLAGIAPPVAGRILLGTGEAPLGGRVVEAALDGDAVSVVLEVVAAREMFAELRIDERLDLARADYEIDPEIASLYDVARRADGTIEFFGRPRPDGRGAADGDLETEFALGPFQCKATITPPSLSIQPTFTINPNLGIDLGFDSDSGDFQYLILNGTPEVTFKIEPKLTAALAGKISCKVKLTELIVPITGPLSYLFAGKVPIGVGFELDGKATAAAVGFKLEGKATADLELGVACASGDCAMVNEFDGDVEFNPQLIIPESVFPEFDLTAGAFLYGELNFGPPLLQDLQLKAFTMKVGPALKLKLAPPDKQASDPGFASDFKLLLTGSAGAGSSISEFAGMLQISFVKLEVKLETEIAHSPTGTFTITPGTVTPGNAVQLGQMAEFNVTLDSSTFLGTDAVESVEIQWLEDGELGPGRPGCTSIQASPGQTTFSCQTDFLEEHAGEQTFYAFIKAKLFGIPLIYPLEIAKDAKATVNVGDFRFIEPPDPKPFLEPGWTHEEIVLVGLGGGLIGHPVQFSLEGPGSISASTVLTESDSGSAVAKVDYTAPPGLVAKDLEARITATTVFEGQTYSDTLLLHPAWADLTIRVDAGDGFQNATNGEVQVAAEGSATIQAELMGNGATTADPPQPIAGLPVMVQTAQATLSAPGGACCSESLAGSSDPSGHFTVQWEAGQFEADEHSIEFLAGDLESGGTLVGASVTLKRQGPGLVINIGPGFQVAPMTDTPLEIWVTAPESNDPVSGVWLDIEATGGTVDAPGGFTLPPFGILLTTYRSLPKSFCVGFVVTAREAPGGLVLAREEAMSLVPILGSAVGSNDLVYAYNRADVRIIPRDPQQEGVSSTEITAASTGTCSLPVDASGVQESEKLASASLGAASAEVFVMTRLEPNDDLTQFVLHVEGRATATGPCDCSSTPTFVNNRFDGQIRISKPAQVSFQTTISGTTGAGAFLYLSKTPPTDFFHTPQPGSPILACAWASAPTCNDSGEWPTDFAGTLEPGTYYILAYCNARFRSDAPAEAQWAVDITVSTAP